MPSRNFEQMLAITKATGERLVGAMSKYPDSADKETSAYHAFVHFFFCKAYKTYQAFALLCAAGFVEDAEVLSRTIFELFLQAKFMSIDPKRLARTFAEHEPIRNYNMYLRMKRVKGARIEKLVSMIESKPLDLDEMKRQYDEFKDKFLKPGRKSAKSPEDLSENWWGQSVYWLAKKLGAPEESYATVYWSQSDLVHSGSTSMREYLKKGSEGWLANCYPNTHDPNLETTVPWASGWLFGIYLVVDSAWGLNLDHEIAQALAEVENLARQGPAK
jgi:hypothetical protein